VASGIMGLALSGVDATADTHDSLRFLLNPWLWPGTRDLILMAVCGLVSALGFFLLGQGYRLAQANLAAPFEYVALPWAVLWGYLFFGNLPDAATISGAAIIVSSGLYVLYRERQASRRRSATPRS
jgi:S-adenosylmethionine uptake transporter